MKANIIWNEASGGSLPKKNVTCLVMLAGKDIYAGSYDPDTKEWILPGIAHSGYDSRIVTHWTYFAAAKPSPVVFSSNDVIAFGEFMRDNYYVTGSPKMVSYNPKHPNAKISEIFARWCLENEKGKFAIQTTSGEIFVFADAKKDSLKNE